MSLRIHTKNKNSSVYRLSYQEHKNVVIIISFPDIHWTIYIAYQPWVVQFCYVVHANVFTTLLHNLLYKGPVTYNRRRWRALVPGVAFVRSVRRWAGCLAVVAVLIATLATLLFQSTHFYEPINKPHVHSPDRARVMTQIYVFGISAQHTQDGNKEI